MLEAAGGAGDLGSFSSLTEGTTTLYPAPTLRLPVLLEVTVRRICGGCGDGCVYRVSPDCEVVALGFLGRREGSWVALSDLTVALDALFS